ncbi:MAG: acyl--CoA ligase, partial [Deltaproteobacteria bacterium]|nr:acyl--CoA ligase [Deltaproteobacteria bacterium]
MNHRDTENTEKEKPFFATVANKKRQYLIHHFLETSAELYPDKVALIHKDVQATYAEINARANRMASWLSERGVHQGDRVALILKNGLEYVITYFAVLKAGAVEVSLSTDIKPDGLTPLLKSLQPKVLVSSFHFEKLLKETDIKETSVRDLVLISPKTIRQGDTFSVTAFEELVTGGPTNNPNNSIDESSLAGIVYTSGSTGKPRGVMLSHKNVVSNTHAICRYLHLTPDDIQMVVLPFFYVMGKSLLNTHFAVAGTVVINNQFAFLASVLNDMVTYKVTGFSGVPSTYAYL